MKTDLFKAPVLAAAQRKPRAIRSTELLAIGFVALALSACKSNDAFVDPVVAADYHARYPIVLERAPSTVDVYAVDAHLDVQALAAVHQFVARYRQLGGDRIAILSPSNRRNGAAVTAIRKALYDEGLRGNVVVGSYPNYDRAQTPVRLSFLAVTAAVEAKCGNFPSDLGSGTDTSEWANVPYENFGCPTQKMLAAQIDDPRDVAGARAVTEPDVQMRLRAIDDVRKGQDPGTAWKVQNSAIGSVGGS